MGGIGSGKHPTVDYRKVAAMRRQGCRLKEIGDKFGITRERVRQICEAEGLPAAWNGRSETYINRSLIAPYLEKTNGTVCLLCGGERPTRDWLCGECKPFLRNIRRIKVNLRLWKDKGHAQALANALCQIRKYDIKPSDLELA